MNANHGFQCTEFGSYRSDDYNKIFKPRGRNPMEQAELDAIEQSGREATRLFEGLQVEKHPIHGYRGEMQGYIFNDNVVSAYGITNANPQFGEGGLPQYYVPNIEDMINKNIVSPVESIKLNK